MSKDGEMGSAERTLLSNLNYRCKGREMIDGDTETEENMHGKPILKLCCAKMMDP